MHVLIFGATGKTGRQLITQGLQQGHVITAFVRHPNALHVPNKNLTLFTGNISNPNEVEQAIKGQNAVISVLGNKTSNALWKANTTISDGLHTIIQSMDKEKVKRLVFVTSFGVAKNMFLPEKLFIRIVLRNIFADLPKQEKMIQESDLDYTIVRPARLTEEEKTGRYKAKVDLPIGLSSKISRSDLADFLLKSLQSRDEIRKTITLSY